MKCLKADRESHTVQCVSYPSSFQHNSDLSVDFYINAARISLRPAGEVRGAVCNPALKPKLAPPADLSSLQSTRAASRPRAKAGSAAGLAR